MNRINELVQENAVEERGDSTVITGKKKKDLHASVLLLLWDTPFQEPDSKRLIHETLTIHHPPGSTAGSFPKCFHTEINSLDTALCFNLLNITSLDSCLNFVSTLHYII